MSKSANRHLFYIGNLRVLIIPMYFCIILYRQSGCRKIADVTDVVRHSNRIELKKISMQKHWYAPWTGIINIPPTLFKIPLDYLCYVSGVKLYCVSNKSALT